MKLAAFLLSCLMAFLAGHMVNYSIIFLSLEWFDSHALAGLGYGLCFGPPIILGWIAGVYCDRYSPRIVLLVAQNSFLIALAILYWANESEPSTQKILLLTSALFSGIGWSFVSPARFATLPYYLTDKKLALGAIALNLMVMMGFGLAPMLLKQIKLEFDWQGVIYFASSLFILSSLILLPLRFQFKSKPKKKVLTEVFETFRLIGEKPMLKQLLLLAAIGYLLMGPMQVILPNIAEKVLGLNDVGQGNYLSLIAFSLIAGGLLAMWTKKRGKIGLQLMLAIGFAGVGIGYLGQESRITISVIVIVLAATAGGVAISLIVAGLQHYSPIEHRGRVMSFYTIIGQFVPALSGITAGILAQILTPASALLFMGLLILFLIFYSMWRFKTIRQLENL